MNKKKMGAWATALFLAAALVLPAGTSLAAEGKPGILPGGEGLEGKGVSKVYYGAHGTSSTNQEPIYTRVLAKEGNHLVVLSEYILEDVQFDTTSPYSNEWADSNAKTWCESVYDGFAPEEQAAVRATTKSPEDGNYTASGYEYEPCGLTGEHLYFLSAKEAINPDYGFEQYGGWHESRIAYEKDDNTKANWWLLRSAYAKNSSEVGAVSAPGGAGGRNVEYAWGARPAFQIDLDAVLFASAAMGGKAGKIGTLGAVGTNDTDDWKLTLKDSSRTFAVSNAENKRVNAGSTLTLDYTGAKTGEHEYVSAMLIDGNGKPAYYGRMMAVTQADGEVDVMVPAGLAVGEYTLQVFNEQYNGDKETDVASVPVEIPLTVVDQENVAPLVEDSKIEGVPVNATQGEKVTFTVEGAGMDNLNPVAGDERWKPISWSVNPSGDFAGDKYTQSFETAGMKPGEHTLTITYTLERFNGSKWVDTGDHSTKDFPFTLLAAPPQGGGEPSAPAANSAATPSELTGENPGTGDPLMIGWLVAAGVSAFGAGVVLVRQRKKA